MTLSEERDAQGGLEQTSHVDRVASLTGIRAVAALLVVGTHAAYTTGKYTHGYWGLVGARLEIGVPIFFVLSGFLLFRPWVKSAATGGPAAVAESLCAAPGSAHHARLRHHRAVRLRAVRLPRRGTQSRAHLDGIGPQPHADADLLQRLPRQVPAPGPDPDVEPGGGGRVLRGAAAVGIRAAGADLSAPVAAEGGARRARGHDADQPGLVDPGAHRSLVSRRRPAMAAHLPGLVPGRHGAGRAAGDGCAVLRVHGHTVGDRQLFHRRHTHRGRTHDVALSGERGAGEDLFLRRDRRAGGGTAGPR